MTLNNTNLSQNYTLNLFQDSTFGTKISKAVHLKKGTFQEKKTWKMVEMQSCDVGMKPWDYPRPIRMILEPSPFFRLLSFLQNALHKEESGEGLRFWGWVFMTKWWVWNANRSNLRAPCRLVLLSLCFNLRNTFSILRFK